MFKEFFITLAALLSQTTGSHTRLPNIVFILADDLGLNDVGFHGSNQIPTPNIDALAYNGIIINNYYSQPLCTPSRSALMTGKYPINTGMQHLVLLENEPRGLSLDEVLLSDHLKKAGYQCHAVGKWHLGFYKKDYTPTHRGFDSHMGYYQGYQDYFTHEVYTSFDPNMKGYDMRRNLDVYWEAKGKYSTDLFTNEAVQRIRNHNESSDPLFLYVAHLAPHTGGYYDWLQAPEEDVKKFDYIQDPDRRKYAAMVSKLDDSVGSIMEALQEKSMLDNTIVVFVSDNGAPTIGFYANKGSNYPLRGMKSSGWEGGTRVAAAIWSPLLKSNQRVSNQMMHIVDWLPTLYSAAGMDVRNLGKIDGLDMWDALSEGTPSPRTNFVYNIDDLNTVYAAIREGDWKYVEGNVEAVLKPVSGASDWLGESGRDTNRIYDTKKVLMSKAGKAINKYRLTNLKTTMKGRFDPPLTSSKILKLRKRAEINCGTNLETECDPKVSGCLFNIKNDPCEKNNLASRKPQLLKNMKAIVESYKSKMEKSKNVPGVEEANPIYWNNTWTFWADETPKAHLTTSLLSTI